jgi:hypothetical protein
MGFAVTQVQGVNCNRYASGRLWPAVFDLIGRDVAFL